jgi:glycosyltransferase involved in cell wall biosynthesis
MCELCPIALMEAMAAGRAVVATRVGGSPELIQHGIDGVLVPPEDPIFFTRDHMVRETHALYLRVLAGTGVRAIECRPERCSGHVA